MTPLGLHVHRAEGGWAFATDGKSKKRSKEAYEYASNLRLAGNLKGELLLIHGASDEAVPFSHTMKMVEALIRAEKPFDLLVLPEWGQTKGLKGIGRKLSAATFRST
ncbi:MAG: alpha/beta hydrolase family protein [Acidobacteriota bacterium]